MWTASVTATSDTRVSTRWIAPLLATLACAVGPSLSDAPPPATGAGTERHRGISWVGGPERVTEKDFQRLVEDHVNWIVQTPFGWQRGLDTPRVAMSTGGHHMWWGESDEGLIETGRLAKKFGIKVLLKPHLWITRAPKGKWRTDIAMKSDDDWRRWFDDYGKLILHYARLAEAQGFEGLCIGTELHQAAVQREKDWRKLIRAVREIYGGKLTYAANWWKEFEEIRFWDDLDWIGIQAYFPLADKNDPSVEEIRRGWKPHLEAIERVHREFKKPVLFTEIGYKSTENAAVRPWEWGAHRGEKCTEAGLRTQANGYDAFFTTVWNRPWMAGVYWWKWFPRLGRNTEARAGESFSPQNKPAETIMTEWYRRDAGPARSGKSPATVTSGQ